VVNVFDKLSFDHAANLARNEMDAYMAGTFDEAC
jgi:hypothetical protein